MQNTFSSSTRLIIPTLMLVVLSACGGGGGSSDNDPPAQPVLPPPPPPPPTNTAPVLDAIGAQMVEEEATLSFSASATDAESTTPVLSVSGLPTGATFDAANGTFNWQPTAADVANSPYSVIFTATDEVDSALTDTETIEITVTAAPITAECTVGITSPVAGSLEAAGDPGMQAATATLAVEATLSCGPDPIPAGWGVKLSIAGASNGSTGEEIVTSEPFIGNFSGLNKDEYTLTANVVDDTGANVTGANTEVEVTSVGLGDYYIALGDSITSGDGDNIVNGIPLVGVDQGDLTSADGRTSGGYPALLNDDLTAALGYPHLIINAGMPSENSTEGLVRLPSVLSDHPDAQRVLVMYGMNDARTGATRVSTVDFTSNMQQIIDAIVADGKQPVLARVNIALADRADVGPAYPDPNAGSRSLAIRGFNTAINQLVIDNSIAFAAPNFYNLFFVPGASPQRYESEYSDFIHPDRTGYQSMTNLWIDVLIP